MYWPLRGVSNQTLIIAIGLIGGIITILQVSQMWLLPQTSLSQKNNLPSDAPVVLWWTSSFGEEGKYRTCSGKRCYFTKERSHITDPNLKVIMFYGSNFEVADLPIPRNNDTRWALLHEESPRNNPIFMHNTALKLFNYSATFSRYSNVPLTLLFLPKEEELLNTNYFLSVEEKNQLMASNNLAPVLYIQTDCDSMSDRDSYVSELMKFIPVDSYGSCLNNRQFPKELKENYLEKLESEEFLMFVAQYKFTLALENAVCDDYITEKLWRPLIVGSVPIYYGSPTFKIWLPNNKSAISIRDFENPKNLADFLLNLNNDDKRYEEYLTHKMISSEVSIGNDRLLSELRKRPKNVDDIFGNALREFECFVCQQAHDTKHVSSMTTKQYNCSIPKNMIDKNETNPWLFQWMLDKCAAKLLTRHIETSTSINSESFTENVFKMLESNDCDLAQ